MFQVFRNAWKDLALRKKILFTLLIIVIFRLGAAIFVPFLDPAAIKQLVGDGTILNYLDVMTGGSLSNNGAGHGYGAAAACYIGLSFE